MSLPNDFQKMAREAMGENTLGLEMMTSDPVSAETRKRLDIDPVGAAHEYINVLAKLEQVHWECILRLASMVEGHMASDQPHKGN